MNPTASELPEGFEQWARTVQDTWLLDNGYNLLQEHSRRKKLTQHDGRKVYEYIPIIRAKYSQRRE